MYSRRTPSTILPGKGRAFENLGTTQFTTGSSTRGRPHDSADDAIDEFDFLSPNSTPPPTGFTDEHGRDRGDIVEHYEKKSSGLKNLKFKKKSDTAGGGAAKEPELNKKGARP